MRNCVTHYYACDCREEKFKRMEAALAEAKNGLECLRESREHAKIAEFSASEALQDLFEFNEETARKTLATIDTILEGEK